MRGNFPCILNTMNLDAYLKHIDYRGDLNPNRGTLTALMRAHLLAVPFENLDVHLGVPISTRPKDAYAKVVERNRGGWCFELNGLFKWALEQIGFDVQSLAGFVGRVAGKPEREASHLFLRVDCDEPLFVDIGYGGSLWGPMPLAPSRVEQPPYTMTIHKVDNGFYRWTEHAHDLSSTLDFTLNPLGPTHFDATNQWLQTAPDSSFVRTLTAQRRYEDRHLILRGLVKQTIALDGASEVVLESAEELVRCLRNEFALDVPEVAGCWEKMRTRHGELFNT